MWTEATFALAFAGGATLLRQPSHIPIIAIGLLVVTMRRTYTLWVATRREDEGIIFPAISEMGVQGPGRRAYQIGFSCVGVLLCLHMYNLSNAIQRELVVRDVDTSKLQSQMIRYGFQAAIGAGVQGIFTLEHHVSAQSIVHWIAAALFMHGSVNHSHVSAELYANSAATLPIWISRAASFRGMILKYSTVLMFLPIVFSQIFGAVRGGENALAASQIMNSMGLMQWFIIGQFSLLFASYAIDLSIWTASSS